MLFKNKMKKIISTIIVLSMVLCFGVNSITFVSFADASNARPAAPKYPKAN